jgi:hypothetical protein
MISIVVLVVSWLLGCWAGKLIWHKKEEPIKPITDNKVMLDELIAEQVREAIAEKKKREPVWPNELEISADKDFMHIAMYECTGNERSLVGRFQMTRAQAANVVEKIVARF